MATLLVLMAKNAMNVVVIIFPLNVLDFKTQIKTAMVYMKEMVGVVMIVIEAMMTAEESVMALVSIAPAIDAAITVNLGPLGNIFILLMNIQLSILMLQPGSSAKSVTDLLLPRMGFKILFRTTFEQRYLKEDPTNYQSDDTTPQERNVSSSPYPPLAMTQVGNQVMIILMTFNMRVSIDLWLLIQLIMLTLEDLFPLSLPLKTNK